jgi:SAM-dependent methyltransferase
VYFVEQRQETAMTTPAKFDPQVFKATTRAQWDSAAEAWNRWGGLLNHWLGPATELMLDMCDVGAGSSVLDVAAGAGEQTITAAKRVGPMGRVHATDLSPGILEYVERNARQAGLTNVATEVKDGEALGEIDQGPFDAVISRVGLIYFPDQHKALTGMYGQLKPGGKVGAVTYASAEANGFFSIPVSIIRRRAQLPPPLPGQPGPFSLGDPAVLEKRLADAGFNDIRIERVQAPVRLASARECVRFERESFGALHQMLSGLSAEEQGEAWVEIERALERFEDAEGFTGPCELVVASGRRVN